MKDILFDIVVIKEEEHSHSTVIKISPEIRDIIMKHGDKLFISLSRCDISDRYHYKQCFHCQRLGHISTECPQKDDAPTCMYCAGIHSSKQCTKKLDKKSHKCSNCLQSSKENIKKNANTHNSAYHKCPTIERECKKISENTLKVGKNY